MKFYEFLETHSSPIEQTETMYLVHTPKKNGCCYQRFWTREQCLSSSLKNRDLKFWYPVKSKDGHLDIVVSLAGVGENGD